MKTLFFKYFDKYIGNAIKGRLTSCSLFGIAVITLLVLTNCATSMVSPVKDGPVVDKNKAVQFAGGASNANMTITIQARNPQNVWVNIGNTTSVEWTQTNPHRYFWGTNLIIPGWAWADYQKQYCATTGESALVRAQSSGDVPSVINDWVNCYSNNMNTFPNGCYSPESPNVRVGSLNYRDFGKECANKINFIRSKEGKPDLQIDNIRECEADCDSQCNYEWELTHAEAHHCKPWDQQTCNNWPIFSGAVAQNECSFQSTMTIDDILDYCIYDQMYLCEKKLLETGACDISLCKVCPYPTTGHYTNMINTTYTKVSCGLYKVSDGHFKSVQNFFDK